MWYTVFSLRDRREGGRSMQKHPIDFEKIERALDSVGSIGGRNAVDQFEALQQVATAFAFRQHTIWAGLADSQDVGKFYAWYTKRLIELEKKIRALVDGGLTYHIDNAFRYRAALATIAAVLETFPELYEEVAELEQVGGPNKG